MNFDIVISGGSLSAPAAALMAARTNPAARVLLIEPTDWLGGQATSQGVSAIDNAWHEPARSLMRDHPEKYYPKDYLRFLKLINSSPETAPGSGMAPNGSAWVSREAFDPRTAAWVLDGMIGELENLTLLKMTVVKNVHTVDTRDENGHGQRIDELTLVQRIPVDGYRPWSMPLSEEMLDWYDVEGSGEFEKVIHTVTPRQRGKGLVVIDASELGDVLVMSGAVYTVGRELESEEGKDGNLPSMDEAGTQSIVFPFCVTGCANNDDIADIGSHYNGFEKYFQHQKESYFSLGDHSWEKVWTYRRLKFAGPDKEFDSPCPNDVSMQNWYPGNDYPYGTILRNRRDAAHEAADWYGGIDVDQIANAEKHALAWYRFYQEQNPMNWNLKLPRADDPLNMMGTANGLSKFPYIRGTRRIVGLHHFRILESSFVETDVAGYGGGTSHCFHDSVGIGNYAVDIHPTINSYGIEPSIKQPAPFYLPYRAMGSVNVRNLLACGKTTAATYITNSAYRLHPIEWAWGTAAGAAAALMARDGQTNYDLLREAPLSELKRMVTRNAPIGWQNYDSDSAHEEEAVDN